MTIDEAKQLEVKLANNILNNIPFAQVVQVLSAEATRRAKDAVDNASEAELIKMKEDFEKAEADIAAQQQANRPAPASSEKPKPWGGWVPMPTSSLSSISARNKTSPTWSPS